MGSLLSRRHVGLQSGDWKGNVNIGALQSVNEAEEKRRRGEMGEEGSETDIKERRTGAPP